ncbi:MAG: hypothetical protein R3B70_42020 [Polyangiaceae bacterium]
MSNPTNEQDATQLASMMAQMDEASETADPNALDPDEEAAGLPDEEDAAGPEEEALAENTGDVRALRLRGKSTFNPAEVTLMMKRAFTRGRAATRKAQASKARRTPAVPRITLPANMVHPNAGHKKLIDKWKGKHVPFAVRKGHYFFVGEVLFEVGGNAKTKTWARLKAGTRIDFFHQTVDDDVTIFGKPGRVNLAKTNYSRQSKKTYNEQDFLIQTINMREAGFRIAYPEAEINNIADLSPIKDALTGGAWLWDDGGALMPKDIYHDFTERNLLYNAFKTAGVLFFQWDRTRVGGNGTKHRIVVDKVASIPDQRETNITRTSGGADVLTVPDGYVITDNPDDSDEGAFSATIEVVDDVIFPFTPIDLGGGAPVKPNQLLMAIQLSLYGTSFARVSQH